MQVTSIGWILIPVGIGLYLFAPKALYAWMVFFLPFSATAVVNVAFADSISGVQPTFFFGALWLAKEIPRLWRVRSADRELQLYRPARQLGFFLLVVMLSLIMPVWIRGRITIDSAEFAHPDTTALQFTSRHITQAIYVIYGVLLTICVAVKNLEIREFMGSVRLFVISGIFTSFWGLFQLYCYWSGIPYPAYIFNTSETTSALGYLDELQDIGLRRISSVTTEPSILAQYLLIVVVFALFAVVSSRPLISKTWDRLALIVIVTVLLVSTSTTAYVGLAVTVFLYMGALVYLRILRPRHAVTLLLFTTFVGYIYEVYSPARDVVDSMLLGKAESYSGIARLLSIFLARDYFLQYPILGVGWGSVTSDDLVFKLLSNTGILGLLTFSSFLLTVGARLWRGARILETRISTETFLSVCMLLAFLVLLFTNVTTGFVFAYGHAWFVFGLAMSVPGLHPSTKEHRRYPPDLQPSEVSFA